MVVRPPVQFGEFADFQIVDTFMALSGERCYSVTIYRCFKLLTMTTISERTSVSPIFF